MVFRRHTSDSRPQVYTRQQGEILLQWRQVFLLLIGSTETFISYNGIGPFHIGCEIALQFCRIPMLNFHFFLNASSFLKSLLNKLDQKWKKILPHYFKYIIFLNECHRWGCYRVLHCKKGQRFSRPMPGCYLPNSPWMGIIKLFPYRESLVSDIPAGENR